MTLWHIAIQPIERITGETGALDPGETADMGLPSGLVVRAGRGFLIEGDLTQPETAQRVLDALVDPIVESATLACCSVGPEVPEPGGSSCESIETSVHVLRLPGVTDPEGDSALEVLKSLGVPAAKAQSVRSYRVSGADQRTIDLLTRRVFANAAVERALVGAIRLDRLEMGSAYAFSRVVVPIRSAGEEELANLSRRGGLSLNLEEMRTIRGHFRDLSRDPTDCELETIAQTWSEHCSHKTLRGLIEFNGEIIDNLLKSTIFEATRRLNPDWLVSVFSDNAGIVRFDDEHDVCFKVETHNHPSAIDPYGGANTGIGGVIRDPLGAGLGAKPICNTDVFCIAPPNLPFDRLPQGVLHPRRILKGVVAGVRDYGNRMGIPTVNGALVVDEGYLANPLVFCGTVGVLPKGMAHKEVREGDRIVAIGGRTGRDGIHGATFSSAELTAASEEASASSVQIGNAIIEKMVLDVVLQARDRGLFRSITDCGAGGFSSAIGEMGADLGAEVELSTAPLKYEGLTYTEIWISEAQERMVLAVPPERLDELMALCANEGVEATDLGRFAATGRLVVKYQDETVADLSMEFLHEGRPKTVRKATFDPPYHQAIELPEAEGPGAFNADLLKLLANYDVCSKEWIVRQYDHEVQARTVLKPLVGIACDGPGDAAVILPVRSSDRGLAVACGLNPRQGALDPYAMAGCAIDEAIRNCVAVGADPDRIALLDNFCWGSPENPQTLGSLVLAAQGCRDAAIEFGTPFISGKDSLYNEYVHEGQSQAIPPTLLISAMGIVPNVRRCATMDFKSPGNLIYIVGQTTNSMGGSVWCKVKGQSGGEPPAVDPDTAKALFRAVHRAIAGGLVRTCHDISDGGLAVALAESAFAGGIGARVSLRDVPCEPDAAMDASLLFSESPSRFIVEVEPGSRDEFQRLMGGLPIGLLGETGSADDEAVAAPRLVIDGLTVHKVIDCAVSELKAAWRAPLDWS